MDLGTERKEARQRGGLSREETSQDAGSPVDLAATDDDALEHFPAESTLLSSAAGTPASEAARRRRIGRAILPVVLIATFLGGAALGAFLMYRSERSEALGTVASQTAASRASEADKTLGVGTTGPADGSAPPKSVVTPVRPDDPALPIPGATSAAAPESTAQGPATPAPSPLATAAVPAPAETQPRAGGGPSSMPASDLSGEWTLNTVVESSSLSMYEGLRLGYRLHLEQRGNALRGSGHKVLENGNAIGGGGQTPITVAGTVDGDRLRLTFTERGTQRSSSGTFVLFREGADGLRGRFASDAARSAGRVEARRASSSQLR